MTRSNVATFDRVIAKLVARIPEQWRPFFVAVTWFGEAWTITGLAAALTLTGLALHDWQLVVLAVTGMAVFGSAMLIKHFVRRGRPDTMFVRDQQIKSYSFPSGHAVCAAYFYGLLGYLSVCAINGVWGYMLAALLGALAVCIGVSRVYLGAHFPSDVVVGWLYGALWLGVVLIGVSYW